MLKVEVGNAAMMSRGPYGPPGAFSSLRSGIGKDLPSNFDIRDFEKGTSDALCRGTTPW